MKHTQYFSNTLIILPFGLPFTWSADYELQTAIALTKKRATVIAYLANEGKTLARWLTDPSPIFEFKYGILVYRPLHILPFHRFRFIRQINNWITTKWLIYKIARTPKWKRLKKIFWTFSLQRSIYPDWFSSDTVKIYDCVDIFMNGHSEDASDWQRDENRIIKTSDVVFTNSPVLYAQNVHVHPRVFLLPEGMFVPSLFPSFVPHSSTPRELNSIPHPRVLFMGNINTRLDFSAIRYVSSRLPTYSFIFVGAIDPLYSGPDHISVAQEVRSWRKQHNVHLLPPVKKNRVASYINSSDIGFIPYDIQQSFNLYCYPMKVQEFFSQGKPIISSAIEALRPLSPLVLMYKNRTEAVSLIKQVLSKPWPKSYQARQRRIARSNSVDNKLAKAEDILLKYFSHVV